MKDLKFRELYRLAIVLTVLVVFCSSCEKDDEVVSDYVGTWVAEVSIPTASGYTSLRDVMTFSENSVIDLIQIPGGSADKWIDYMNLKGSISVSGNMMTVTIAEIGISSVDPVTGMPTGTIIGYKEGSSEFEAILSQSEQSKTFESEYSVLGDKLTMKTDNNDDGDYLDGDEVTVYTKQ
ncbi:MAG: hypothetical protein K0M40_07980 [Prolixibacteraceae bacterium]|nr:hypothetical protein [Prolixibacteraceae bacterium]